MPQILGHIYFFNTMDQSLLPNIYDFISHTYPFSLLNELQKDALSTAVKISYHSVGEVLKDEDICSVGLFMIRAGSLEQINTDGSLRARLGVGDSFAYTQLNKTGPSDYKVIFLENTLLYLIDKQTLNFIIEKNDSIKDYFASQDWVRLSSSHIYLDEGSNDKKTQFSQYSQKVQEVMSVHLAIVSPNDSISSCAQAMADKHKDEAMVVENGKLIGIVTQTDMTKKVVAKRMNVDDPIKNIMSTKLVTIEAGKTLFNAFELMINQNVQSLPVLKSGELIGSINTSHLLQNSQLQALYLIKKINKQDSIEDIKRYTQQKENVFKTLVNCNVSPHTICLVMSKIADSTYKRIMQLAEKKFGPAPCNYAFFVCGSLARNEVQFLSDQDNGIIIDGPVDDRIRTYFKSFASFVNQSLDFCGYPLCDGNYMASNEKWCTSYDNWIEYYNKWILEPSDSNLLNISVFLDIRFMYGDEFLVSKLKSHFIENASKNNRFLAMLSANALAVNPPIGMFKQFVLQKNGKNLPFFNIKKQAINIVVELARIYALCSNIQETDTMYRLQKASLGNKLSASDCKELQEAYTFINGVRFNNQLKSLTDHTPISNNISPDLLSQFERNHLKDAFRIIAKQQDALSFRFKR